MLNGRMATTANTKMPIEHLSRRAALELAHDAVFGHEVNQPRRAAVTDAQSPLEERARPALFANDDLDGRFIKLVALAQPCPALLSARAAADLKLHELLAELDWVLMQVVAHPVHFA